MDASHDRYDELALGHVLGGLDPVDSAEFRSHLVACRTCRLRVAELRDLASELEAAEREERTLARLKTEVRSDEDEAAPDEVADEGIRGALPLVAFISVIVLAAGFWAYQLRAENSELLSATERRETTLAMLAEADRVDVELERGVTGTVVTDRTRFAFTLAGLPTELPEGHILALWLEDATGESRLLELVPGPIRDGRLAMHGEHDGAAGLLVTVQAMDSLDVPDDHPLVRAELDDPVVLPSS